MSMRAMACCALLACAAAAAQPLSAGANERAEAMANRFAGEAERSSAAKGEADRKSKDERKREAERRADAEREKAAAKRAEEMRRADEEKARAARKAQSPARPAQVIDPVEEAEMLARVLREAELMQAAEEARVLAEQQAAVERARAELKASQEAEAVRVEAEAKARATEQAGADRARIEMRARQEAETARAEAEAKARAVAQAEAVAAERAYAEWVKRVVAGRKSVHSLNRARRIRQARHASRTARELAEAQARERAQSQAQTQSQARVQERAPATADEREIAAVRPAPMPSPMQVAGPARGDRDVRDWASGGVAGADDDDREAVEIADSSLRPNLAHGQPRAPGLNGDAVQPEQTVTVLMVLSPGTYGIRRNGPKVADPILCTLDGCYISNGNDTPARFMPGRKALNFGNTVGQRAGACRRQLGCVFRAVSIKRWPGYVQPVDLHILKHDRRRGQVLEDDSDCHVRNGRLDCRSGIYADTYAMWVIPESLAESLGGEALDRALEEGLAAPRSADLNLRSSR